ncbi:MAG: hypothetical protein HOY79_17915 [Streptomyces sp.]|nr:hypothetical protein [Streptomyces sp.]
MTAWSHNRNQRHALFVKGLRDLLDWLEQDSTIPVPDQLPIVIGVDSTQHLADIAVGHDLNGPMSARDGSVYLFRAFNGGVTWQAVVHNNPEGAGDSERHARAWAAANGYILTPRTATLGSQS